MSELLSHVLRHQQAPAMGETPKEEKGLLSNSDSNTATTPGTTPVENSYMLHLPNTVSSEASEPITTPVAQQQRQSAVFDEVMMPEGKNELTITVPSQETTSTTTTTSPTNTSNDNRTQRRKSLTAALVEKLTGIDIDAQQPAAHQQATSTPSPTDSRANRRKSLAQALVANVFGEENESKKPIVEMPKYSPQNLTTISAQTDDKTILNMLPVQERLMVLSLTDSGWQKEFSSLEMLLLSGTLAELIALKRITTIKHATDKRKDIPLHALMLLDTSATNEPILDSFVKIMQQAHKMVNITLENWIMALAGTIKMPYHPSTTTFAVSKFNEKLGIHLCNKGVLRYDRSLNFLNLIVVGRMPIKFINVKEAIRRQITDSLCVPEDENEWKEKMKSIDERAFAMCTLLGVAGKVKEHLEFSKDVKSKDKARLQKLAEKRSKDLLKMQKPTSDGPEDQYTNITHMYNVIAALEYVLA